MLFGAGRGVSLMLQVGFVLLSCGCRFQYRPILSFGCRLHNRLIPCCCGLIQFDFPSCHAPSLPVSHAGSRARVRKDLNRWELLWLRHQGWFRVSALTWDLGHAWFKAIRVPHLKVHALKILPPCGVYITMLSCWSF